VKVVDCDFLVSETIQQLLFQLIKMLLLTKLLLLLVTAVITYRSNFTCNNCLLNMKKKHNFLQAHFKFLNSARRHKIILSRPAPRFW
jgi:hypothetical protein